MANVPYLSTCLFSYFFFVPLVFFFQMFTLRLYKWVKPDLQLSNTKLFEFGSAECIYMCLSAILLITFSKTAASDFSFNQFYIYVAILLFLFILLGISTFLSRQASQFELDTLLTVSIWLLFALATLCFCSNMIILLFNIELIATVYFFFFLFYVTQDNVSLIKFKNMLSNYLFTSFFTICFFSIAIMLMSHTLGTLDFNEINMLASEVPFYVWNVVLLSVLVKLGGPGVFFFKVEIYKTLTAFSLVFFSICSFFINSIILLFIFKSCVVVYTSNSFIILTGLLFSNLVLLSRGLQLTSFCQFLGLSAVNTWGLLMLFFLINASKLLY